MKNHNHLPCDKCTEDCPRYKNITPKNKTYNKDFRALVFNEHQLLSFSKTLGYTEEDIENAKKRDDGYVATYKNVNVFIEGIPPNKGNTPNPLKLKT